MTTCDKQLLIEVYHHEMISCFHVYVRAFIPHAVLSGWFAVHHFDNGKFSLCCTRCNLMKLYADSCDLLQLFLPQIKHGYDAFLMLATDGLCYVLSDDEMVNIINSCRSPSEAAGLVSDQALHFGSEDNSSVIVVPFGAWGKYISSASSLQYRFGRNMLSKRDWIVESSCAKCH